MFESCFSLPKASVSSSRKTTLKVISHWDPRNQEQGWDWRAKVTLDKELLFISSANRVWRVKSRGAPYEKREQQPSPLLHTSPFRSWSALHVDTEREFTLGMTAARPLTGQHLSTAHCYNIYWGHFSFYLPCSAFLPQALASCPLGTAGGYFAVRLYSASEVQDYWLRSAAQYSDCMADHKDWDCSSFPSRN